MEFIKDQPTLGSKLKELLEELEAANIKSLELQHLADLSKIREKRLQKSEFTKYIIDTFVLQLEQNKIPYLKIKDYTDATWIREAVKQKAEFQDIWNDLVSYFNKQNCHIVVNDQHDGIGMESWITITLKPQLFNTRG